jgi:DHA2 family multidrug resistance protein-like MFS transporter
MKQPKDEDRPETLGEAQAAPIAGETAPAAGAAPAAHEVGLEGTARALAFLAIATAITLAVLDGALVNLALPRMARDLAVDAPEAIWIVNAYQLAVTVALLPFSSLGDGRGYKRVYMAGLAVFTVASLLCAFSPTLEILIAARALQGLGAAGIMSVNFALVRIIYPPRLLARGAGNMAVVVALATALGPTISAFILSIASWHWLFLINIPLGLFAFVASARYLPHTPSSGRRFDALSAVLSALTVGLFIRSVDLLGTGTDLAVPLAQLAAAVLIGAIFVRRQIRMPEPLLPVDLLRRPVFSLSLATSICAFGAQSMSYLALAFLLQDALGWPVIQAGLLMTAWPVAIAVAAPIAGRLVDHYPPVFVASVGLGLMTAGLVALAFLPSAPPVADLLWRLALCGFGFGLFQTPNNLTIISSVPRLRSGSASGMQSSARLVGQTLGVAAAAAVFGLFADTAPMVVILIAAIVAGVAACVGVMRVRVWSNSEQ